MIRVMLRNLHNNPARHVDEANEIFWIISRDA